MHITVDGGTWANTRGYGRFTRELLKAAAELPGGHTFTLVVDDSVSPDAIPPRVNCIRVRLRVSPAQAASATGRRSLADMRAMGRALGAQSADCVFFPSVYTYTPVLTRAPVVVCFHDVIPERYPHLVFATSRARLFWTLKTRAAIRQASKIVTVSGHARGEIAEQFRLAPGDIDIIPEAPSAAFSSNADAELGRASLETLGLHRDTPFVMYVGGLAPHKNLGLLIDAAVSLRRSACAALVLLVVGDYTHDVFRTAYPELRQQVQRAGADCVFFTGPLDDATLAGLMRITQALVLPSFDEGFGLPGVEAAACGAPVVATKHSALPDVLGDGALYFDPADGEALERTLHEVLADQTLRSQLAARGAERARRLTWTAAAERLLAILDSVAAKRN